MDTHFIQYASNSLPVFLETGNTRRLNTNLLPASIQIIDQTFMMYKKMVAPYWGGRCQFQPTCSEFGLKSIQVHGLFKGAIMTSDRLSRDHFMIQSNWYTRNRNGMYIDFVPRPNHDLLQKGLYDMP